MAMAASSTHMPILNVLKAQTAYPTGDPSFKVQQAFPAAITAEEADPFLMLDHFGPSKSDGLETNPDSFPVGWHPHRGMDICTYLISGVGRHADSMGNRGNYETPGLQWISVGSGIEHAEGGGTPKGEEQEGFQIWINVPKKLKMADPRYGVGEPKDLPTLKDSEGNFYGRVVAGKIAESEAVGPFKTATDLEIIDFTIEANKSNKHTVNKGLDNAIAYVYRGEGQIQGRNVAKGAVIHLDARAEGREIEMKGSSSSKLSILFFAGKRIGEPIAWRGPIVMTSNEELQSTFKDLRSGNFPPVRAPWDYKRLSAFPKDKLPK